MTYASLAALSRYARTGLLDIIRADFIRDSSQRSTRKVVIIKHTARNGMILSLPYWQHFCRFLLVVLSLSKSFLVFGEWVVWVCILLRDYNVIMCILLILSLLTLIGMLVSDLLYAIVDPRISFDYIINSFTLLFLS